MAFSSKRSPRYAGRSTKVETMADFIADLRQKREKVSFSHYTKTVNTVNSEKDLKVSHGLKYSTRPLLDQEREFNLRNSVEEETMFYGS